MKQSVEKENEKWPLLASYFEREGAPVGEVEMTLTVNGLYSIPDEFMKLDASGAVDAWPWAVKFSDIILSDGKLNQRELTEEEKKEADNKKKKPEPTKKGKQEEQSKEELERIERERLEKEEKERRYQEDWNALDEKGRFYKKKETPTEEPWISFGKNSISITKSGEKLIDLEDEVNGINGCYIEFSKLPPPDEDPKKRPKPKNMSPDDIKPITCIGWVDYTDFYLNPGLKEISLRVPLMLKDTLEKKFSTQTEENIMTSNSRAGSGTNANNKTNDNNLNTHDESGGDYLQNKKTYIYIKISLSNPINPPAPERPLPDPFDLIKRENKTFKQITPDEIASDFRKQLKIAIEAIAKEYVNFMGDAKNNLIKKEKNNVLSNLRKEERDSNITKFLYHFNISGKAELLKEKLKRYLVRIVREIYKKKTNILGVFKDQRDQFYSQLFAYATDEVKLAMDEYVFLKKDELHEHIISSYDQSRKEVMQYAIKLYKEVIYYI
jgi:hypothetical protein